MLDILGTLIFRNEISPPQFGKLVGETVRRNPISTLADSTQTVHTPTMSLKPSALLAFIGMFLLTVLLEADFINTVTGIMHDVVPAMALLRSPIYVLASLAVTAFFWVFQRSQS
jgi:hypothetical protein